MSCFRYDVLISVEERKTPSFTSSVTCFRAVSNYIILQYLICVNVRYFLGVNLNVHIIREEKFLWIFSASWISEIKHHRHWQKVLAQVSGLNFPILSLTLPAHGTILGGCMNLRGTNLALACFHGINFRAKSWALFTMEEPLISFTTEAQDIRDGQSNQAVVQFCKRFLVTLDSLGLL